jgi:hypothetical protein
LNLAGVSLSLGAAMASGFAAGQASPAQQAKAVPAVALEFRALTADGDPVLDLKSQDVVLKVGGRVTDVLSLELVQRPSGPPPFATNALSEAGQDVLLVLDEDSFAPGREQSVRDAVRHLLAGLSPRDRVGLVQISVAGGNPSRTARHGIEEVLAGFASRAGRGETADDVACRTQNTLGALAGVLEGLVPDQPTTVVVFSAGLAAASAEFEQMAASSGFCEEVRLRHYEALTQAALGARASIYAVHVLDGQTLAGSASADYMAAGVESLAGAGGGTLLTVTAGGAGPMARLAREMSTYYQLTFQPAPAEADGGRRRLDVQVARQGIKVRARSGIVIPKAVTQSPRKGPSPRDMMRVPTLYRDLPLRAAAYSSGSDRDKKVKVVVQFEPAEAAAGVASAMIMLFDARGRPAAQWSSQGSDLAKAPFMAALVVAPGDYHLRLTAVDRSGGAGSVDDDIRAGLTRAGSLSVSALVLGVAEEGTFQPRLQFGAEPAAIGYFEIYGPASDEALAAILELAPAADAPALVSVPVKIVQGSNADHRIAYGAIPIGALQAADFDVRAIVAVDGQPVARLARTLRKVGG